MTDLQNKTIGITLFIFSIMAVFACNNQPGKKAEDDSSEGRKFSSEKTIDKQSDNTGDKDIKSCEDIVTEILTTSPRYLELTKGLYEAVIKNGGLSIGINLEGSPNPDQDKAGGYSKTYDFAVYEMYSDRQLNIARFSFNPKNNLLYVHDEVEDKLIQIEYDRSLLIKYKKLCR